MLVAIMPDDERAADDDNPWNDWVGRCLVAPYDRYENGSDSAQQLRNAVVQGSLAEADRLLRQDPLCAHGTDGSGNTALHYAAAYGDGLLIDLLIRAKAAINHRSNSGCTPMDEAMYWAVKDRDEQNRCRSRFKASMSLLEEHGGMPSDVEAYHKLGEQKAKLDEKAKQKCASSSAFDMPCAGSRDDTPTRPQSTLSAIAQAHADSVHERRRMPLAVASTSKPPAKSASSELEHFSDTVQPLWKMFPETFGVDGWD